MSHKDLDIQFRFMKWAIPDLDIQFGYFKFAIKDLNIHFGRGLGDNLITPTSGYNIFF